MNVKNKYQSIMECNSQMNKTCENCFYSKIRYGFRTGFKYLYCTKGILEKTVASNHTCKYWSKTNL